MGKQKEVLTMEVNLAYALPLILSSSAIASAVAGIFVLLGKRADRKAREQERQEDKADKQDVELAQKVKDLIKLVEKLHRGQSAFLYDRIKYLCLRYIGEKCITGEELEDLLDLHVVYQNDLDGNGTLDTFIAQVKSLQIVKQKSSRYKTDAEYQPQEKPKIATDPEKPIILVVDDAATWTYVIKKALGNVKYTIFEINDPLEVKPLLRQITPQLFILDCHMPDLSGLELIPIIRAYPGHEKTPIIMITGDDTTETLKSASELDVSEFISKKFKPSELREAVEHYLK